jgi:hypothetical protein
MQALLPTVSDPMVQMLYTSVGYSRDFGENLTIGLEQGRMIETKPDIGFSNPLPTGVDYQLVIHLESSIRHSIIHYCGAQIILAD